ncbi:glycerol-3-phosphate dehydrogenase [Trichonephila clavipes]|nr:glycerol-3-phosphate dehydrogenase [Trichonephila clavipes]
MLIPIESSSIVSTSLSNDIQPPSTSNTERDSKLKSKTRIRKRKKELLKKLNEEKIEIKTAPYRRKKPAPADLSTDEEDMITYDVEEDELEQHPDLAQKDGFNEFGAEIGSCADGHHNHSLTHPHQILIDFIA